jgi:hypothetical protein
MLRDSTTNVPLTLRAQAFVHAQPSAAQRPRLPQTAGGPIRILLVICRPGAGDDVPFRSVASRLLKGLSARPASCSSSTCCARQPSSSSVARCVPPIPPASPITVHFDGHGVYAAGDVPCGPFTPHSFADSRPGRHDYLAFENPARPDNLELVDGPRLGALLVEANTPVLVLNACLSAHADEEPRTDD